MQNANSVDEVGLRARKQRSTRDAIWNAAIDLFAEKGFDETTIDEIAESAQVSRRSFFRYFESKGDLMAYPVGNLAEAVTRAIASCPRSESPSDLYRHAVAVLTQESAAESRTPKVMEIASRYSAAREALASRMSAVQTEIENAFEVRCKSALTAQVLSSLTLTALSLSTRHWFTSGQKKIDVSTRKVLDAIAKVATE